MVILLVGPSHVGKTLFAQLLLEKLHFPTLSLDHLKMGLIRAGITDLTPEDDDKLTDYLWPVAAEIIKTAIENRQNLIVEGCYVPETWAASFPKAYLKEIRAAFIVMSEKYVRTHFGRIQRFANVIEYRKADRPDREALARDNARYLEEAKRSGTPVLLIGEAFQTEVLFDDLVKLLGV